MMNTSERLATAYPSTNDRSFGARAVAVLRWPFTNRFASPIWLALRLYLGWIWLNFGLSKLEAGWLTSDPVGQMFRSITNGYLPVPLPFYRGVAQTLLDLGITPYISHTMPFLELAVALAFFSGVLVAPAAIGGSLLVVNIILTGIGTLQFDGRIIAYQLLMVLAWRVAGYIGFERLVVQILKAIYRALRSAREPRPTPQPE